MSTPSSVVEVVEVPASDNEFKYKALKASCREQRERERERFWNRLKGREIFIFYFFMQWV